MSSLLQTFFNTFTFYTVFIVDILRIIIININTGWNNFTYTEYQIKIDNGDMEWVEKAICNKL